MSPRPRASKETILAMLRGPQSLPIRLGAPTGRAEICAQEGRFRVRELDVSRAEIDRARNAAFAAGRSFSSDHVEALLAPTGRILVDVATFEELRAALVAMPWPSSW